MVRGGASPEQATRQVWLIDKQGLLTTDMTDLRDYQAALAKGVSEELFDRVVIPIALTRPGSAEVTPLDRDA